MRSSIEIVAELSGGRTVLRRLRAGGHLALRETGPGIVHLVGTAAGPLGGDEIRIAVRVGHGARLAVRSAAATIVLPARHEAASAVRIEAEVAEGGLLDLAPDPTIVCAGADLTATTLVRLTGDARARLLEEVVLGRSGEPGGRWRGRTAVLRDGAPLLRHAVDSALITARPLGAADALPSGELRAIVALADSGAAQPAAVSGLAVAMPLTAGGLLATALGAELAAARRDLRAVLDPAGDLAGEPPIAAHAAP